MFPKLSNIYLKSPYFNGKNFIFKITEKKNKKQLAFQIETPPLIIHSFNRDYNSILVNSEFLTRVKSHCLLSYINSLEKQIVSKKKEIFNKLDQNYKANFKSIIKKWSNNSYIQFYLYDQNIEVYDNQKNKTSINNLKNQTWAKLIIWVNKLIVSKDSYYLRLEVMQIKLIDPLPPIGCIISDDFKPTMDNQPSQANQKYLKMLKMGIPKGAVINECIKNGVNPDFLDQKNIGDKTNLTPNNKPGFLSDLQGFKKVKLKKCKPIQKRKFKDNRQMVVSLSDIQNILKSLKKTASKKNC